MRKGHGEPRRLAFAIEAEGGDAGAAPFTRARSTPGRGNAPPFAGAGLLSEPTELQRKARAKVRFFALVQVADSPDKAHTRRVTPSEDLHCELPRLRHGKKPAELRSFQRAGNSRRRSDAAGSLLRQYNEEILGQAGSPSAVRSVSCSVSKTIPSYSSASGSSTPISGRESMELAIRISCVHVSPERT